MPTRSQSVDAANISIFLRRHEQFTSASVKYIPSLNSVVFFLTNTGLRLNKTEIIAIVIVNIDATTINPSSDRKCFNLRFIY